MFRWVELILACIGAYNTTQWILNTVLPRPRPKPTYWRYDNALQAWRLAQNVTPEERAAFEAEQANDRG